MKLKYVTSFLDISSARGRALDFYVRGAATWRRIVPAEDFRIFSSTPEIMGTDPFTFHHIVEILGGELFSTIEAARIRLGANMSQCAQPWYNALCYCKLHLMSEALVDDPDATHAVWVDCGFPSHSWVNIREFEGTPTFVDGFHAAPASWLRGWGGGGVHNAFNWPGPGSSIAGGVLHADRETLFDVLERFDCTLREVLACNAYPSDEDIMTVMHTRTPRLITQHKGFRQLGLTIFNDDRSA